MCDIVLRGTVTFIESFTTAKGYKMERCVIETQRKSGYMDEIICNLPTEHNIEVGMYVYALGKVRTKNYLDGSGKHHVHVYVFITEIRNVPKLSNDINAVYASGTICKNKGARVTPKQKVLTDYIIAINREESNLSDYIPTISWGSVAMRVARYPVGTKILVEGRLQSRKFLKTLEDGTTKEYTATELSACKVLLNNEEEGAKHEVD